MLTRTLSCTIYGLEALPVEVEVDAGRGLPTLTIVGLPDQAVKEARERVRAAIVNSQYHLPSQRVTVNLAPADMKKEGGVLDLAIALGILAASHQLDPTALEAVVALGELALDGSVRPIHGILPMAFALRQHRRKLLVPAQNAQEAALVEGLDIIPVTSLHDAVEVLSGTRPQVAYHPPHQRSSSRTPRYEVDFAEVNGQAHAKRALEVAVAGGHHALLIGPPGSGKTMLAQRIPTIQPDLSADEVLETMHIHSIAGLLIPPPNAVPRSGTSWSKSREIAFGDALGGGMNGATLITQRPFRSPHHTSSAIALVGGGTYPKPGEVSLAHRGVLFLDELPEFHRDVLESLRQPLEEGTVTIVRAKRSATFPAQFMLVAAMNPCPCGYLTDPRHRCRCPSTKVASYLAKISGPLLDRIDLHIDIPAVPFETLTHTGPTEPSATIKARIVRAQRRQRKRLKALGRSCNARLRHRDLRSVCRMSAPAMALLKSAMQELSFSARSYDKILKIGRTISDLAGAEELLPEHLAEAIQYRSLDRQLWV